MSLSKSKTCFLISLPRSGSTITQQILSNHSQISTSAEPWLLLPFVYSLKNDDHEIATYDKNISKIALREFLENNHITASEFYKTIGCAVENIYSMARKDGSIYFLDKTTRNYLIIDELSKCLPESKFIFLVRNPVTVFFSFIEIMIEREYDRLGLLSIRSDLFEGLLNIKNGIHSIGSRGIWIKYEDLVENSEDTIRKCLNHLDLAYEENIKFYEDNIKGKLKDPRTIQKHNEPVKRYMTNWTERVNNSFEVDLAIEYLNQLDPTLFDFFGYSKDELLRELNSLYEKPTLKKLNPLLKFDKLVFQENLSSPEKIKLQYIKKHKDYSEEGFRKYMLLRPHRLGIYLLKKCGIIS